MCVCVKNPARCLFIPVSLSAYIVPVSMASSFVTSQHFSHSFCFCTSINLWSLTLVVLFFPCFTKKYPVYFTFVVIIKQLFICPFF